jgi:hypothetical protein
MEGRAYVKVGFFEKCIFKFTEFGKKYLHLRNENV